MAKTTTGTAATNLTSASAAVSRAEAIKLITFSQEMWSEAQQVGSKFKLLGSVSKSMDGGNFKLFQRTKKRRFQEKKGGVQPVVAEKQAYDRRALFVKVWDMTTQVDIGDIVDSTSSVLQDSHRELMNEEGRVIDCVLLSALLEPVSESGDADKDGTTEVLTASISLTKRHKIPFYYKGTTVVSNGADATTGALKFNADVIEDILYHFAVRDVEEDLCATLTPEVKRVLRKEADFKNAENIFAPMKRSVDDNRQGFNYKGINWISCSASILPIVSQKNAGLTAATSATSIGASVTAAGVDLDSTNNLERTLSYTGDIKTTVAAIRSAAEKPNSYGGGYTDLSDAADDSIATLSFKSKDVLYVWGKSGLYFADRPQENISSEDTIPLLSQARQGYMRISFGATLIDDDYALAIPIKGSAA